eukprot:9732460-Lingulodinium_polyedra.AAC.1
MIVIAVKGHVSIHQGRTRLHLILVVFIQLLVERRVTVWYGLEEIHPGVLKPLALHLQFADPATELL